MPSSPSQLHGENVARVCPQCHDRLVFSGHYPVLNVPTPIGQSTDEDIHYEKAWVCRNEVCDYRELFGRRVTRRRRVAGLRKTRMTRGALVASCTQRA